ncbi:MAG: di-trans,poly-cis-decaprenylcistransferase [Holosporaceae bacterium]|jgi:undecaprenyl diphosphate synthase|nr:di-trans,poly-cis-decaprenylcistransferase [Holosporaceae bacterium]
MSSNALQHLAFILDGNRRWAELNGVSVNDGHRSGGERVREITSLLPGYGIRYVTYYLFSTENWHRPKQEVDFLMSFFCEIFDNFDQACKNNVRFLTIGNTAILPVNTKTTLQRLVDKTKNSTELTIIIAINYSGRDEIIRATKKIASDIMDGKMNVQDITEKSFESYMDTRDIPFPDAIVRTSEKRISNFLIWQMAYSEMFFVNKYWPDFNAEDLRSIIHEYSSRKRRYGR